MSKKSELNEMLRNIMNLFAARNKVLWESAEGWASGSLTVPGVSGYSTIYAEAEGVTGFTLHKSVGGFLGGGILATWSGGATATGEMRLQISGDRLTRVGENCYILLHSFDGGHTERIKDMKITKIIGVEPIQSKILSGGGAAPKRNFSRFTGLVRGCFA